MFFDNVSLHELRSKKGYEHSQMFCVFKLQEHLYLILRNHKCIMYKR